MSPDRAPHPFTACGRWTTVTIVFATLALITTVGLDVWAAVRPGAATPSGPPEPVSAALTPSLLGEIAALAAVLLAAALAAHDGRARRAAEAALWQSERSYRGLFEGAHDAVLVLDPDSEVVLDANPRAEALYELPRAALIGTSMLERSRSPDRGHVRAALAAGAVYRFETTQRTAAGAELRLEVSASAVRFQGRVAILSVNRDVTERWRAAEALRASEERFRALVDGVQEYALVLLDPAGRVAGWNAGATRITGHTADQAAGQHVSLFCPPEEAPRAAAQLAEARASGRAEYEGWRVRRDGTRFWAHVMTAAVRRAGGELSGYTKITRDLTERRAAAAAVRDSERFAQQVLDSSRDCVKVLDPDGRLVAINRGGLELLEACERDALLGRAWVEFWGGADRAAAERAVAAARAGGVGRFEGLCPTLSGTPRWWDVVVTAVRGAGAPGRLLVASRDVTERVKADQALRLRDRALEAFEQGVCIADATDPERPIVYANRGFERMTGYPAAEVLGRNCRFLQGPDTDPGAVAAVRAAARDGRPCLVELLNYRKDGTPFWNALSLAPVHDPDGNLTHLVAVQTDVTPFKRLEEQFRQSQKMEAVGHLAGGVAHDFNNLLTVISGCAELALEGLPADAPAGALLGDIGGAAGRAAELTGQLLAFSRRQVLRPRPVGLNDLVSGVQRLLTRLLGEDVRVATALHPAAGTVLVDPGQLEQVLLNLAVNARDAMPTGGRLTIETGPAELDPAYAAAHPDVRPGRYALVAVADTGCGMTDAVKARVFEPFFTTKGAGQGTGLGLATVYGIVKQSGGHVAVYSEVGVGTAFKVYLPLAPEASGGPTEAPPAPAPTGSETVLLVEDEPRVRGLTAAALRRAGYAVLEADCAGDADRVLGGHGGPVHLLVTDVVMPGESGRVLAERLTAAAPGLRVLFMSGYTDDAVVRHGVLAAQVAFLQKPFTLGALLRRVREVLDGSVPRCEMAGAS